jgi:hypothetical protein
MKRLPAIQEESAQDSFLDVIANLVGVIIILVMLVGAKATRDVLKGTALPPTARATEPEVATTADDSLAGDLKEARSQAMAARAELERIATQLVRIRQEAAEMDANRVTLAMHRSVIEEDIAKRRESLDGDKQQEFDVQRRIGEAQIKLDHLMQQQLGLLSGPETVEELESVPTPLARTVDGESIHLRLKGGLVSVVPFNELIAEVQHHADDIARRLQSSDQVIDTYGPIDGYRIRMTVARVADPGSLGGPRAGQVTRSTFNQLAEVLPTSEAIGQNVEQALMPGGSLHQYLQTHRRQAPTVVVWLYTDSFDDFRLLKRTLWELGFSFATRPLEPGTNIGASPHGTKAAAQ